MWVFSRQTVIGFARILSAEGKTKSMQSPLITHSEIKIPESNLWPVWKSHFLRLKQENAENAFSESFEVEEYRLGFRLRPFGL